MSLKQTINGDIKKAMLAKDKDRLRALRAVKSMILLAETESGSAEELTEAQEMQLLMKGAKQRKDSAATYKEQGREDLAEPELIELAVFEEYLPAQMTDEELEGKVKEIIARVGAEGPKDMGKVMGPATQELKGQADGKRISDAVKKLING